MAQFESGVKYVPYSQEQVFNKLSDLRPESGTGNCLAEARSGES